MGEFKLIEAIIRRSKADTWASAAREWICTEIEYLPDDWVKENDYETCLCGHYPIRELCYPHNEYTKENVVVGNCCVNKFPNVESEDYDKIFKALSEGRINR